MMSNFEASTLSGSSSEDETPRKKRKASDLNLTNNINHSDKRGKMNCVASSAFYSPIKRKREDEDDKKSSPSSDDEHEHLTNSHNDSTRKKMKTGNIVMSSIAQKMMQKMGYRDGSGLGKNNQGRVEIIETSKQRGRRGLGLHLEGLEPSADINWQNEEVSAIESFEWMPECTQSPPLLAEMRQWTNEGPKKVNIDDENEFCSKHVLSKVLSCKSVFDSLEPEEMRRARTRSNPFETIRGVIFQNRAAVKMANLDARFEFMFTQPLTESGDPAIGPNDLLYFADICAGPGGFSEYILWRRKWEAKGFGFTLKGPNDFRLEEFFAGPPESFEPHYGLNGINGDGNIYDPNNLREFRRFVLANTDNKGVHFVMADGGFSVEGQENIQEILSKQLYLCQFLCALYILRVGGHFVCKVFDLFTAFSVGLVYLLYRCFKRVAIVKPNTSRPANSERYIVCKWRRDDTRDVEDYLFETNCRLEQLKGLLETQDVNEIVSIDILKDDIKFFNYVVHSNEVLGEKQCLHLSKIQAFSRNTGLYEERQSDMRKDCLIAWKLPDKLRSAPTRPDPLKKFSDLLKNDDRDHLARLAQPLDLDKLAAIKSVYDYRCILSGVEKSNKSDRGFFLGLGRTNVFQWDGTNNGRWKKLELTVEIPCDTLLFAEIVYELKGEGRGQRKIACLQIIDAIVLGGKDIREKHFTERIAEAKKFAKAISKSSRPDFTPVRVKDVYRFEDMQLIFERLEWKLFKGGGGGRRLCYCADEEKYFLPHGVIFFKTVKDPWSMAFSRSRSLKYFFNHRTRESRFDIPKDAIAAFKDCYSTRLFWAWEEGVKIHEQQISSEGQVHRHIILDKINDLLPSK